MAQLPTDARLSEMIRAFEIRIENQIEVVAKAVCDGREFARPAKLLDRLTELHARLKVAQ